MEGKFNQPKRTNKQIKIILKYHENPDFRETKEEEKNPLSLCSNFWWKKKKKDSKGGKTRRSGRGIVSRSDYQKTACFTEIWLAGGVRPVITSAVCPANFLTHIHHAPPTDLHLRPLTPRKNIPGINEDWSVRQLSRYGFNRSRFSLDAR